MTKKYSRRVLLATFLMFTLVGCTGTLSQVRDGTTAEPVWPQAKAASPVVKSWFAPALDNLRKIKPGLEKREVYALIGAPMFKEGMVGVHEWDYAFKLADAAGQPIECQYKVLFDDAMRSAQTLWQTTDCAEAVEGRPVVAEERKVETKWIDLSADALFAFDSAKLAPEASGMIEQKIVSALEAARLVREIRIIGYTDQLGSDDYNRRLSLARAESVKGYLVGRGVPAVAIVTEGRGSADPVVSCPGGSREERIACMKPNRRVRLEISVTGPQEG